MKEPLWIDLQDALAIHDMMLAQHGGRAGIRDKGLLDSALHRPKHLFTYKRPKIHDMAAAYAAGIAQNHAFVDGNKRTGFLCAATFLEVNGYNLIASEVDVVTHTVALAGHGITEVEYSQFLAKNSKRG